MKTSTGILLVLAGLSPAAQAQLFLGNAAFFQAPSSQLGSVTNNLVITNFATHFTASGQVIVNVGAGAHAGVLASWEIRRPLNPTWGTGTLYTGTQLIGYSLPPGIGSFCNTSGASVTELSSLPGNFPGGSTSIAPMVLTNGAATWANIYGSFPFTYVSGGTAYVSQRFFVDGVQLSGPGGNWVVDVPLTSYLSTSPVPEPGAWSLFAAGGLALLARRRWPARAAAPGSPAMAGGAAG